LKDNILKVRDFGVRVFIEGSTYYAVRHNGNLLSSSATPETVIAAALANRQTIFIGPGIFDLSSSFTGFDMLSNQHVFLEAGTLIRVPNGYTGYCFRMLDVGYRSMITGNGRIGEQGTPCSELDCFQIRIRSSRNHICKDSRGGDR
jgi:hypothetical protein